MPKGENVIPFRGSAKDQGRHAVSDHLGAPRPAAGESKNQFRANAAAGSGEDAGVSSASASSFVSLGSITHAVVLRLRGGFPMVKVMAGAPWEEEQARRPFNQPAEGDEPR